MIGYAKAKEKAIQIGRTMEAVGRSRMAVRLCFYLSLFTAGAASGVFFYHEMYASAMEKRLEALDQNAIRLESMLRAAEVMRDSAHERATVTEGVAAVFRKEGRFGIEESVAAGGAVYDAWKLYEITPAMQLAVMRHESGFRKDAVSSAGAVGLMQVLPSTGKMVADGMRWDFNENTLFIPEKNILIGVKYLRYLHDGYWGRVEGNVFHTSLSAYHMGPASVNVLLGGGERMVVTSYSSAVLSNYKHIIREYNLF